MRGLPAAEPGTAADARRAEVITLAADLFDRHGYASVSMEQIAAAAGMAKPTLYHYFRAKDEILRGIHETFIDLLLGAMTDIFGLMETHRGHVRVFFEHHRELPDAARSSPATEVPGVDVAALARYLPDVLADYDTDGELSGRLLTDGHVRRRCRAALRAVPRARSLAGSPPGPGWGRVRWPARRPAG